MAGDGMARSSRRCWHCGRAGICDAEGEDEDCNPTTFGDTDDDDDGFVSMECCNTNTFGAAVCGDDCDDANDNLHPTQAETCDNLDGTLTRRTAPQPVPGLPDVRRPFGHGHTACAITSDGDLYCWGRNLGGVLGIDETTTEVLDPMRVYVP